MVLSSKKLLLILAVILIAIAVANPIFAATKKKPKPPAAVPINFIGTVTAINSKDLSVSVMGLTPGLAPNATIVVVHRPVAVKAKKPVPAILNSNKCLARINLLVKEINIGDAVNIRGVINSDKTVTAKLVVKLPAQPGLVNLK